jgi:asparagine synthetase B (glutamine-hydrolysing)
VSSLRILASDIRSHLAKRQRNEDRYYFTTGFLNQLTEPPFSYPALLSENHTVELTNVRRLLNYLDTALCSQGEYPLGQRVDAFWDRRLLELCLALPATLKVRDGFRRYLCRKPFEDILPPRITWRRDKMPFSADYRRRYAAQRGRALEYVLSIRPSDPVREIVDVPRLARELSAPDSAVPYRHTNVEIPNSIYLIHFLRQFPGFRV